MNKRRRKPVHLILDIVIGIFSVLLVGAVVFTVKMINEDVNFHYDVESFYYRLQDENYSNMVEMYHMNEEAGVKSDAELEQYYGIAKYFEAASYYRAYQEAGEMEQMKKYEAQMKNAEKEMGQLEFVSDQIDEKLGIE